MKRLKELREQRGFSRKALAERVGCTPSYIWRLEERDKEPSLDVLRKIAWALGLDTAAEFLELLV